MVGMFAMGGARVIGREHLSAGGAGVVVSNQVTPGGLKRLLRAMPGQAVVWGEGAGEVSGASAVEALRHGKWMVARPVGDAVRTDVLLRLDERVLAAAREAGVPVVPAWVFEADGPPFFMMGHEYGGAASRQRAGTQVRFGEPIAAGGLSVAAVREALYGLGADCFESREDVGEHLGYACLRGLKARLFDVVLTDAFDGGRRVTGGQLLAAAMALASWLRENVEGRRVGIVLPPGAGSAIANLGAVLADKVPVNLNFTAGAVANQSAMRQAGLRAVVSASAMRAKVPNFPWPEATHDLREILAGFGKVGLATRFATAVALPLPALAAWLGVPRRGGSAEAALLFTSGSAGDPKGVILSHRNLVGNVIQVAETLKFDADDSLLGCLPIFHSFGLTVTLWYPLCGGPRVVTYVSPLDAPRLASVVREYGVRLMVSTPTFLRAFLKAVPPEDMKGLAMVVTGAEKLPVDLAEAFEARFGIPLREGYGLTETAPVVSVNLTDPPAEGNRLGGQVSHRRGSVGRPVPGIAVRITDTETGAPRSLFETGVLWFRGANIFEGYLGEPDRTSDVLHGRWFRTGDLGRMDEDGFIYIEGRLARFSKIGGEMVPLATMEQHLHAAFDMIEAEQPVFVVCRRPHPVRGEELVVLTTLEVGEREVSRRLRERGLPNLWIPKVVHRVESIPVLASGKLDLRVCDSMAREAR